MSQPVVIAVRPATATSAPQVMRPLPRLLGTLLAGAASLAAHAVPVSVNIGGLPPGLAPTVEVRKNVCSDGLSSVRAVAQPVPLSETSTTTLERVELPFGGFQLRQRVITRYVAQFDAVATGQNTSGPREVRCSAVDGSADTFTYTVHVPGLDGDGRAATAQFTAGTTLQTGAPEARATPVARTQSFPAFVAGLSRGMIHTIQPEFFAATGRVQMQRLELLRPSPFIAGVLVPAATVLLRPDGVGCVRAGAVTRCLGNGLLPEAGGVILRGVSANVPGRPRAVRFDIELAQSFPVGPVRVRATADAVDLDSYFVDGQPTVLDLLPWQPLEQSATVQ